MSRVTNKNRLQLLNSTLALEWHPTKNLPLTANDVACFSHTKAWWVCKVCECDYLSSISHRSRGWGCKKCGYKKSALANAMPKPGKSLQDLFPEIAAEFDTTKNDLSPVEIKPSSNKQVYWKCRKGHSWKASVGNRTRRGSGCHYCSTRISKFTLRLYTELLHLFPSTKLEENIKGIRCDLFIPSINVVIEVDGKHWHAQKEEKDLIKNAKLNSLGLFVVRIRESNMAKLAQTDVQTEGDFRHNDPKYVSNCIFKILSVLSSVGLTTIIQTTDSEFKNNNLFICLQNIRPNPAPEQSLKEKYPNLAKQWHPIKNGSLKPEDITVGYENKVWWKCPVEEDHEWESCVNQRARRAIGCPFCSGQRATKIKNLKVLREDVMQFWDYNKNTTTTPEKTTPRSSKLVWWKCQFCGLSYEQKVYQKTIGSGCPCQGKRNHYTLKTPRISALSSPLSNNNS